MERNQTKKQNILIPAEAIGNNIDLLTEILIRLQVKPLGRAKCVSKQWFSLISDPQFCVSHNRHHHNPYPTPTALLLKMDYYPTHEFQIVPLKQDSIPKVLFFDYLNLSHIHIEQSCNGLLLFLSNQKNIYYICNPTTKQFKRLSFPSSNMERLVEVTLAFDPLKSNHYKVICIRAEKYTNRYQIERYSSETDSWSQLDITFTLPNCGYILFSIYCKGAVHWYGGGETSFYFDVDRECLNTVSMPNLAKRLIQYFGESQGCLHLIRTEDPSPLQFDVLEMAADYSGWFVRYHVNLDAVRIAFPDIIWYNEGYHTFLVLHVIRAQKDEDSIVVIHVNDKVISYNFHDGTSKKLCDLEPHLSAYAFFNSSTYFEILTSV